jgi:hypothetical protein
MDLSKILSISGKSGLFKTVTQTKNGVVVESLLNGKRFTAFANDRISSLEEISVFTEVDDIPLRDVLKSIFEKQKGKAAINHKSGNNELKAFFEEVLANYDKDRVYVSDIKKIIQWYNLLLEKEILNFEEEEDKNSEEIEKAQGDNQEEKENIENK